MTEGGLAVAGILAVSWPVCVALGVGGLAISYARGHISPERAQLIADGRIGATLAYLDSRYPYIHREIERLQDLRDEVLNELRRRKAELDVTYDRYQPYWANLGLTKPAPDPIPLGLQQRYEHWGAFATQGPYADTPDHELLKEIMTWR